MANVTKKATNERRDARNRTRDARGRARRRIGIARRHARRAGANIRRNARPAAGGLGARIVRLPELIRERARRSIEALETTGARAVVSVIDRGTEVLSTAAEYVSEIVPRRRVRH